LEGDEKKGKFWTSGRIIIVLFFVVGILGGTILQHFIIEPAFFNSGLESKLNDKTNTLNLLQGEHDKCLKKLGNLMEEA